MIPDSNATIGVLIVDDHDGYRSVAEQVIDATSGFTIAGSASDRDQALQLLHTGDTPVDLILMDVHLGVDDGVQLTSEITGEAASPAVMLVTTLALDDLPSTVRQCGARGFLPKNELSPDALRQMCAGVYDWPDDSTSHRAGR